VGAQIKKAHFQGFFDSGESQCDSSPKDTVEQFLSSIRFESKSKSTELGVEIDEDL